MRILLVHTYYYPEIMGGAEYSVKVLAEALTEKGHNVAVLCTGDIDSNELIENVTVYRRKMKCIRRLKAYEKGGVVNYLHTLQDIYNPANQPVVEDAIHSFRPDVIHTNCLYDISPVIWTVAHKMGIKIVHTLRDYMLICRYANLRTKRNTECKRIDLCCALRRGLNRFASKYVDIITAPSMAVLANHRKAGFFLEGNSKIIVNATQYDAERVNQTLNMRMNHTAMRPFTFVYLGALVESKGVLWLLNSFGNLKERDARLIFAGKGPLENKICEKADSDDRIQFVGFLNEKDVSYLLQKSDVLICPSIWEEPFGRVIIDAYKNAMPVITSDCGAFPEIVENGKSGLIVPVANIQALCNAMHTMMLSSQCYKDMCRSAVMRLKRFSVDQQVKDFIQTYEDLLRIG